MKNILSRIIFIAVVAVMSFNANADSKSAFERAMELRMHPRVSTTSHRAPKFVREKAATDIPDLIGNIYYSKEIQEQGLYKLKTSDTDSYELIGTAVKDYEWGGVIKDGVYYSTYMRPFMGGTFIVQIRGIDVRNGDVLYDVTPWEDLSCDFRFIAQSQTYDPTTGNIYGICFTSDGSKFALCKMSYAEADIKSSVIKSYGNGNAEDTRWSAIACDADGQLWGIVYDTKFDETIKESINVSRLVKINKDTGELTDVGYTGVHSEFHGDATIDLESGRMFWVVCGYYAEETLSSYLCEVDLTTGKGTILHQMMGEDEIVGLEVAPPAAEDKAPAAVENLVANFPKGTLSGSIDFKAPSTLFDGTEATGELTYHIFINRDEKATGKVSYGENVSVPISLNSEYDYIFDVYVSNEVGDGPQTRILTFIGKGKPAAPANVKVEAEGTKAVITWDAVTESVDGGYVDPAEVTYTVKNAFTGEVVVADTKDCYATTELKVEEGQTFVLFGYEVTAKYAEKISDVSKSNDIAVGHYNVPYENNINSADDLHGFTVIDSNKDGKYWRYDSRTKSVSIEYNQSKDMDDWLITPGIYLEKGKAYTLSYKAKRYDISYPEKMEIKYGKGNSVADMTETILEVSEIEGTEYQDYEFSIIPAESAAYFIGFHGCSAKYMYNIWIDDIVVSDGTSTQSPGVVENIEAAGDPDGSLTITIKFTAPTKTISGSELTELTKIEVFGADLTTPLKTFENPKPGEALIFQDTPASRGLYKYTLVASNSKGVGNSVWVEVFAGIDYPSAPQNVKILETDKHGEVTISWDAVKTDHNGNAINPELVTYSIYEVDGEYNGELIAGNLKDTSYTFQAFTEDQAFVQYRVYSKTVAGESKDGALTDQIPIGVPYSSIYESFAEGYLYYAWGIDVTGGGEWAVLTTGQGDIQPQDDDGGFAAMYGQFVGYYSDLYTGKIQIDENSVNPTLSFHRFVMGSNDVNVMTILVRELGGEWVEIDSRLSNELSEKRGWAKTEISLEAYKGKCIQIAFRATVGQYTYSFLDNIRIGSLVDYDLAVRGIAAPTKAVNGEEFAVEVLVSNEGKLDAEGAEIELSADGVVIASEKIVKLTPEEMTIVSFKPQMSAVAESPVKISAKIVYGADGNTSNNESDAVVVKPVDSGLFGVSYLGGIIESDGSAMIYWEYPAFPTCISKTETFEDADSWAHECDNWTFVDMDGMPAGGFDNIVLPGIIMGETPTSFFIFDDSDEQFGEVFAAHDGNKFMASIFNDSFTELDDWAISPELSGKAQRISFYAKSYSARYAERMEIYYSTGSREVDDFIFVGEVKKVAGEWTLYEFDLPEGALRFAIRSCASDSYLLMIDDVTYEPFYATATIEGFNVYRDGIKINKELIKYESETSYVDAEFDGGSHYYQVTVVYDKGESRCPEKIWLSTDGIADVTTGININSADRQILVNGADGMKVSVMTIDGKNLFVGAGSEQMVIPVDGGVYIVKAGNKTAKIFVK